MQTADHAVNAYLAMWNSSDEEQCRELAEQALGEDAVLLYPTFEARGWREIVAAVARFHQGMPGVEIVLSTGVEYHHGWFRVAGHTVQADGSIGIDGETVGEVGDDGRLHRIIGFHNPLPGRP